MHGGLECLQATHHLVKKAVQAAPRQEIIMGSEIWRMAITEAQAGQLQATATRLPDYCEWIDATDMPKTTPPSVLGALQISRGGGLVVHVPSYLQGLFQACEQLAQQKDICIEWKTLSSSPANSGTTSEMGTADRIRTDYDAVVLAAGAGLLLDLWPNCDLPLQIVRGQSIELSSSSSSPLPAALLCGKYVSPLPGNRILVGATHEFQPEPWSAEQVLTALHEKTRAFYTWEPAANVVRVTEGFRVQGQRGPQGRRPIVGRCDWPHHDRTYLFTGLSSRGLLYHAYYGEALVDEILTGQPSPLLTTEDSHWRRRTTEGVESL